VTLKCRRCARTIEPDEKMIAVTLGTPQSWATVANTGNRLALSPRWHYRCAPKPIREHVPPILANDERLATAPEGA
jgi:hypothetical protein